MPAVESTLPLNIDAYDIPDEPPRLLGRAVSRPSVWTIGMCVVGAISIGL